MACQEGHKDIVKILLDKQADVNIQTIKGCTPLYIACEDGNKDIVKMLLDKQADVNIQSDERFTPLHYACHQGHKCWISRQMSIFKVLKDLRLCIVHVIRGIKIL